MQRNVSHIAKPTTRRFGVRSIVTQFIVTRESSPGCAPVFVQGASAVSHALRKASRCQAFQPRAGRGGVFTLEGGRWTKNRCGGGNHTANVFWTFVDGSPAPWKVPSAAAPVPTT